MHPNATGFGRQTSSSFPQRAPSDWAPTGLRQVSLSMRSKNQRVLKETMMLVIWKYLDYSEEWFGRGQQSATCIGNDGDEYECNRTR